MKNAQTLRLRELLYNRISTSVFMQLRSFVVITALQNIIFNKIDSILNKIDSILNKLKTFTVC